MKVRDLIGVVQDGTNVYANEENKDFPKVYLGCIRNTMEATEEEFKKYLEKREKKHSKVNAETAYYALKFFPNNIILLNKNITSFEDFLDLNVYGIFSNGCQGGGSWISVFVSEVHRIE